MVSFRFGLVADVQHADKDDGNAEGRQQRYRQAAVCLDFAVGAWLAHAAELSFVLTLGDIIDGNATPERTRADFERVATAFDCLAGSLDVHHVIGNHCLSIERPALLERLGIAAGGSYRTLAAALGWRLILLDTTEMSGHSGHAADSPLGLEAADFLASHPMSDSEPQMAPWNGGCGAQQLRWLRGELAAAEAAADRVLVAGHHQVGLGAARATHMAWNWREIQAALLASAAFTAYFAGHDHCGGYAHIDGRHFITIEAMLEAPQGGNAYAFVQIDGAVLRIDGRATAVASRSLQLA